MSRKDFEDEFCCKWSALKIGAHMKAKLKPVSYKITTLCDARIRELSRDLVLSQGRVIEEAIMRYHDREKASTK